MRLARRGRPSIVENGRSYLVLKPIPKDESLPSRRLLLVDAFGDAVSENPCVALATGQAQPAATSTVEGAAGAVTSGVGTAIKGVGDAVKGLFRPGSKPQVEPRKTPAEGDLSTLSTP